MNSIAVLRSAIPDAHTRTVALRAVVDAEVMHLRRLIEKQPSCLLRVGIDGVLMAANDAALRMLGAAELGQVLGQTLTEQIVPDHHGRWHEFTARVWDTTSGSVECDFADLAGSHRTVLLQGVALTDHPDGIKSMILSMRDASGIGRLEKALEEHEITRQALEGLRRELDQAPAEQKRLVSVLEARDADQQRLVAEHAAERAQAQSLAEEHQLALLLKEREGRQHLSDLQSELEQALADRQRLETTLEEHEGRQQQLMAEHAAVLEPALADRQRLETALEEHEGRQQRLMAEHAAERAQVQALTEEHQLALLLMEREGRQQLNHLQTKLNQARSEQERLEALLEEHDDYRQRLVDQHAAERAEAERALEAARIEKERMAVELEHELQDLAAAVDAHVKDLLARRNQ